MLRQVRGPGNLVPREIRWISAQTAGRVERIVVRPGTVVDPDSVLVEMSNSGARLHPADPPTLPDSFDLVIAPGEEVTCEVVHRAELEIGVRFISQ